MPSRSFYEENYESIQPKPGTILPISPKLKSEESSHGEFEEVDGMIIRSTPTLERLNNNLRNSFINKFQIFEYELKNLNHAFKNEFRNLQSSYNKTVKEPILPNLIYILTFTLTGSILVRKRNLGLRFVTPLIFGNIATAYTMPKTYNNLAKDYVDIERKYVPDFHHRRIEAGHALGRWSDEFEATRVRVNDDVIKNVSWFRQEIEKKFS
ncbi:hypothetical protein KGF54_004211 [Candida jiufengensis]|uniref:uncharacterized protein n=1 Tax=Candida jiufengensis TaxID=497108 RepID=UPI0022240113|nr:uncharacterized protein KGF54_004211 [Candida jiufengensis]KAI5951137.1 hypothetical protein KGF54_004211 [Candida jiufengensis]